MKIKHLFLSLLAVATVAATGCKKDESNDKPSLKLDPSELEFEAVAGTMTVNVDANQAWEIDEIDKDAAEWLALSQESGDGATDIEVSVTANSGAARSAKITFRCSIVKKTLTITQAGKGGSIDDGDGTKDKPYTVAQAKAMAEKLDTDAYSDAPVYMEGIVVSLKDPATTIEKYGSVTLYVSDDGKSTNQFYVYALVGVDGAKFTSEDTLPFKAGSKVVLYGYLQNYKGNTPEMTRNSSNSVAPQLVSVEGGNPDTPDTPDTETVTATGLVVAVNTKGFLFKADDGMKYVFDQTITPEVSVGDNVTVTGSATEYNGTPEIEKYTVIINSTGNVVTYPEAVEITSDNIASYTELFGYVKATGNLSISGSYYNVNVDGASKTLSLAYAKGVDASLAGKNIDVEGYFVGLTGGSSQYFNIVYTKVAESATQPVVEEPGEGSVILTFPDDNSSSNGLTSNQYVSTWTAKTGDVEFSITGFNNNNWKDWNYIRCGRKNNASLASISTKSSVETKFDKVVLSVTKYDANLVKSVKLYVSSSSDFSGVSGVDFNIEDGQAVAVVPSPAANLYYKIEFDCESGKSNGFVEISKVTLWVNK